MLDIWEFIRRIFGKSFEPILPPEYYARIIVFEILEEDQKFSFVLEVIAHMHNLRALQLFHYSDGIFKWNC